MIYNDEIQEFSQLLNAAIVDEIPSWGHLSLFPGQQ